MEQADFIRRVAEAPGAFLWFLGAGVSQSSGLPTALDIIWDLKRRYYCSEEHQEISANDLQNAAIREKIDAFMQSRGFPATTDPTAYSRSFGLIFGNDYTRQSEYLQAALSEKNSSLTLGHRAFAGLIAVDAIKVIFTTNFDTVVERALAEVAGRDLAPFHLEGSYAARDALNNDRFPLYCKLHGDFRYKSIKNLSDDLKTQNAEMGNALVSACNRLGLIVAGYSGRDESVMELFQQALAGPNPFPHGLYWTSLKGRPPLPSVAELLRQAKSKRVHAELVEIETFDALMARVWKQIPQKPSNVAEKIGRTGSQKVSIPLNGPGTGCPILRTNALPITAMPETCLKLSFGTPKEWTDLNTAEAKVENKIVCTKGSSIFAWGAEETLRLAFGSDLTALQSQSIKDQLRDLPNNLHLKGFVERAISLAVAQEKPLIYRRSRGGSVLILDRTKPLKGTEVIKKCVGGLHGQIPGLMTDINLEQPASEPVYWAECIRLDLEEVNGSYWLLLKPDVWIWPKRARKQASTFLDGRMANRFNKIADSLLSAWISLLFPEAGKAADVDLKPFDGVTDAGHPHFTINVRTAFARRMVA